MAEGCYTPRYYVASFKGVPFEAEEVTSEHGRRGAEGEFPFSENTAYNDLGRKIRRYTLNGRYVNNAHLASASALIAACESPGPGLLVHPARGALLVACTKLTVTDDPLNEQGITKLDMEFVEAASIATGVNLGALLLGISFEGIYAALEVNFDVRFDIDNTRYYKVKDVLATAASGLSSVRDEFRRAIAGKKDSSKWKALAAMDGYISDPSRMRTSATAFTVLKRSTIALANETSETQKYDAFKRISNANALFSSLPGEAGDAENSVYQTLRILAAANMARAALETEVETIDEAFQQYDEVTQIIQEELDAARATCEDGLYIELRKLQTDIKTQLLNRVYNLPALVVYNFGGGVHSLVAAYEIFNDAKRFREIERRNPQYWPWAMGPEVIAPRT